MSKVITVENLGKKYTISHQRREEYSSLRDVFTSSINMLGKKLIHPFRRTPSPGLLTMPSESYEDFWALNDISFEVKLGDRIGIIGRNGAGKSTLLKILSRITEPTTGSIRIKGRVASLLEVGTGFHPELTGRENIFLNGAILGMQREEIRRKFDEIVAFSEIEKFLDMPVKRYSSGMYVRLAFAVAAHLEPEILIVDEVLAVGDAAFQKKCLGKMQEVGSEGRTVLFVSHNMAAVENLCQTGLVLDKGNIGFNSGISEAVKFYLNSFSEKIDNCDISKRLDRAGNGNIRITNLLIKDQAGNTGIHFPIGAEIIIEIKYKASAEVKNPQVIVGVYDLMNVGVTRFDTGIAGHLPSVLPASGRISCSTESMPLVPGRYIINIAFLSNGVMQDYLVGAEYLDIVGTDYFKTGKIFDESDSKLARVLIRHKWDLLA